ncbi:MAG: DotU family type IV/VI secretion system protein [Pirellulaceae bacterium]|nr:DotU family type IV/VI secretion system protein [Pirellulaceae bacterium]
MSPDFANVIDPIFLSTLQLESRIADKTKFISADERASLQRKIDEAELRLGNTQEWQLTKYALCSWIDAKLIEAPWEHNVWWKENCLEERYFGYRLAHEDFFKRAVDAQGLSRKDALEVFYVAVVLGFRGFYNDSDANYKAQMVQALRLPSTIEGWCRETARSLQLRQGRPQIVERIQAGGSARPLNGRSSLAAFALLSAILVAAAIACFILMFLPENMLG